MAKLFASELFGKSGTVVPKSKVVLKGCFADLDRKPAIFGLGVAFLGVQITDLENRCVAMHGRLDQKCCLSRAKRKNEPRTTSTTRDT